MYLTPEDDADTERRVAEWNTTVPVGTPVRFDGINGKFTARTASPARRLHDTSMAVVVELEGTVVGTVYNIVACTPVVDDDPAPDPGDTDTTGRPWWTSHYHAATTLLHQLARIERCTPAEAPMLAEAQVHATLAVYDAIEDANPHSERNRARRIEDAQQLKEMFDAGTPPFPIIHPPAPRER